jgi:pyruvate/2-oxoglutarate dehydrogenase complex dihydrolipoamide dehydrogenase (E3) component
MTDKHFDIAVIGAGSGGLVVAAAASQFGHKVALFEAHEMGGDCLNWGCVPSKALLAAAKQAQVMRKGSRVGIAGVEPQIDFDAVKAHVRQVIAAIAPNDSQERFEKLGVKVVRAKARFTGPDRLEAGGETYSARRIVIATGSRAMVPPIPGLDQAPYLTNETIFGVAEKPRHLLILGGGPIGMEMAQAFRRLGSDVTVLEAFAPLGKDDPELATVVLDALKAEGVTILAGTKVKAAGRGADGGVFLETGAGQRIDGSHLLVAAGRRPNLEGLDLEAAGVAHDERGVTVGQGLRSSNRKVYAIGDVAGGPQFTHAAAYHAGLVVRNALFGLPVKTNAVIPWVTYTDPELAHAGLTEEAARKQHGDAVKVLRWPFHENDRAQAEGSAGGFVKVVTGRSGRILGCSIVGPQAGELIQPWVLALSQKLKIGAMIAPVLPYPTRGEASRRAAITYYSSLASNRLARSVTRIVSTLIR